MDHLLSKEYLIARLKHLGQTHAHSVFVYLLFGFEGLESDLRKQLLRAAFFFGFVLETGPYRWLVANLILESMMFAFS